MTRLLAYVALAALLLAACSSEHAVWSEAHNFHGNRWDISESVIFAPDSGYFTTEHPAEGILSLRYGRGCPYRTLPMVMEMESVEEGSYRVDTITLSLLPGNMRNGDKATLGVFETADTVRLSPPPSDGWTLTVRPCIDTVAITDVYSLTLQIFPRKD